MRFRNTITFRLEKADCETPVGVSLTVPDEAYTVQQLMERFVNGQRIPDTLFRDGVFDTGSSFDSDDLEKVRDSDFADRDEVIARERARQAKINADQKRLLVSSKKKVKTSNKSVSNSISKKNEKGAAGPGRVPDAKRPLRTKGADEGSE